MTDEFWSGFEIYYFTVSSRVLVVNVVVHGSYNKIC